MAEEKALRQGGRRGTYPGTDSFYLPTPNFLRLLTAALASAQPSRESEVRRGGGNGDKGRSLF